MNFLRIIYHWFWALGGAIFYGFPSEKLIVIGVTGTNGKSTVVALLHEIFLRAGFRVGSLSSLRFKIQKHEEKNMLKMTMPGRGQIQKFLARCVRERCRFAIIEITSEGVRQFRHRFINFDCAIFTNLTPEHIESHGGFEAYRHVKVSFFQDVAGDRRKHLFGKCVPKTLIVNCDDPEYKHFLVSGTDEYVGYTREAKKAFEIKTYIQAENIAVKEDGISFRVADTLFRSSLHGMFNVSNALAAIATAGAFSVPLRVIQKIISEIETVPGRFEYIKEGQDFSVIVDYAHTPDALEKVYAAIKTIHQKGKMICVLGATGGGRDKWKRPEFGKIAEAYCDEIILTNEDPYDEDPASIIQDIEKGISLKKPKIVLDRRIAVKTALQNAHLGDVVVITGKGAEPWMMGPKGLKTPWDDRAIVHEKLSKFINSAL